MDKEGKCLQIGVAISINGITRIDSYDSFIVIAINILLQENVFKELYRASNSGKDGNGLGLHVAMGSIQAQGGKIWFESEENKGTTFFVQLPLKMAGEEQKAELA